MHIENVLGYSIIKQTGNDAVKYHSSFYDLFFFLFLEVSLTRRADLLLVFIQVFDICQRYKYIPRLGAIEFDIHSLFG